MSKKIIREQTASHTFLPFFPALGLRPRSNLEACGMFFLAIVSIKGGVR